MQNLHQSSKLLNKNDIVRLMDAFEQAWSRDTCYPASQEEWSETNRALGQCAVTALVVNDIYGGTFADDKEHNHIWNILPDGSHHDFARTQFTTDVILKPTAIRKRADLLENKRAKEVKIRERYDVLASRVKTIYAPNH